MIMKAPLIVERVNESQAKITRTVEGFTFVGVALLSPLRPLWTIKVWEIPYENCPGMDVGFTDALKANNHTCKVDLTHAPNGTSLVWAEIGDLFDHALVQARGRKAEAERREPDLHSKGPTS